MLLSSSDTPGEVKNVACKRDYYSNTLITLWDPIPTLDLTGIDPDIFYTVELVEITCGQNVSLSHTIVSTNNATEKGVDLMQIYKVIIAAKNNVREARNGPSVVIKGIVAINTHFLALIIIYILCYRGIYAPEWVHFI